MVLSSEAKKNVAAIVVTVIILILVLFPYPEVPVSKKTVQHQQGETAPVEHQEVGGTSIDVLRVKLKNILEANGTEAAYKFAVENGLIKAENFTIPKNSKTYKDLIKQYGSKLENYPTIEGRIILLKAMNIDAKDP